MGYLRFMRNGSRIARCAVLTFPLITVAFAQSYVISTFAGGAAPPSPVAGTSASVGGTVSTAVDSKGNVYFASRNSVFRLDTTGSLTRIAGNSRQGFSGDGGPAASAQLNHPWGVAVDAAGNVYIGDSGNYRIRRVSTAGIITTIAGNGSSVRSGDFFPAVSAGLSVYGVAVDSTGNIYFADAINNAVREVSTAGIIYTLAGGTTAGYTGDNSPATGAKLAGPVGVAVDGAGNIYVADTGNSCIRKIFSGFINTIAGTGVFGYSGDNAQPYYAQLSAPLGVAVDAAGNVYIADTGNQRIRKMSTSSINTVAGTGVPAFSGDGGAAGSASFSQPSGIAVDASGNLYIADSQNARIRKVASGGTVSTIAGNGTVSYSGDGGQALSAQLSSTQGIAIDASGNVYIADAGNNRVRKIALSGVISTVAGTGAAGYSGDAGQATAATLRNPGGVALDAAGNLYIADTGNDAVRKVSTAGVITTVAGGNGPGNTGDGAAATKAALTGPNSVLVDSTGTLYVADTISARIRTVSTAGIINTFAGTVLRGFDGDGGLATAAFLSDPSGMASDGKGNLYFADRANNIIRKVSSTGIITTVAGTTAPGYTGDGGLATKAKFNGPSSVVIDSTGSLYVADTLNSAVRKISGGIVTTIAGGNGAAYSGDGGVATGGALVAPTGMAFDSTGNLYVSDAAGSIRVLAVAARPVVISSVLDAASEAASAIVPGKILVIYGSGLGPSTLVQNKPVNGVYSTSLSGTSVLIEGSAAPILYTSANQISVIAPYGIIGSSPVILPGATTTVTVLYQGLGSAPFSAPIGTVSPSIFTTSGTGAGQMAAVNANGALNSAGTPVALGGYITFYATGVGQTSPFGSDGKIAASAPYPAPVLPVSVTVGGVAANVTYAGAAPTAVAGLTQINVQIPPTVTPGGYVPVVLTVGSVSSVAGATWIAVSAK